MQAILSLLPIIYYLGKTCNYSCNEECIMMGTKAKRMKEARAKRTMLLQKTYKKRWYWSCGWNERY